MGDHSGDTTIKDFYSHVFHVLPENSLLVGRPGVPGFDLFYYQVVNGWRPDVAIPQAEHPDALRMEDMREKPLYTTVIGQSLHSTGGSVQFPEEMWFVPVLAAPSVNASWLGGHPLTLYEARREPPGLIVETVTPQHTVGRVMDGVELVGFDLDRTEVEAGGTLHLTLYWRPMKPPALSFYRVSTILGDERFRETHSLGFGLIKRYQRDRQFQPGSIVVEDYDLVVMSSLSEGEHTLRLVTCDFGSLGARNEEVLDLAEIRVIDQSDGAPSPLLSR